MNRFDILHSHGYKGNVALGFIPKRWRKIPFVSTLHGYTSTNRFSKNKIYEWLDLMSLKHIDSVILVNSGMLSNPKLSKVKGVEFHVVNNGIPISELTQKPQITKRTQELDKTIISFCQKGFIIGTIGRLSPEKGHHYLISGLAALVKIGIDARVVIIGEGLERKSLEERIIESGLQGRVLLPGYRTNARDYLAYFHAFALTSLTEGLPITLLEAMQAGTPIIATNVGGIPEVLDNGACGILIEPRRADLFAEGLAAIFSNGDNIHRMVERAYQRLKNLYSARAMAEEYLKTYEKML
jgi:glycosyltransferase involved in cell wall biosynthesis